MSDSVEIAPALPDPIWVDRPKQLTAMVKALSKCASVAVDTESNSLHAYREQVCLIQFSTPETDYLVDPLALEDLSELAPIFANPAIEKIFHAAEYDLICLKRDFCFDFENLFDTMIASRILGRQAVGLASLLEGEFGLVLNKTYQRANWGQRPLKPEMLAYARLDTHYLFRLRDRLREDLVTAERDGLADEDFRRMCGINAQGCASESEMFWRIQGIQTLEPHQVSALHELFRFREDRARELDRPPFKVLSNQALLEVAQVCPKFVQELDLLPSLSRYHVQRYGKALIEAVQRGQENPPMKRPTSHRPDDRLLNRLEMLKNWRKEKGRLLSLESDVILPRDTLMTIAEHNPTNSTELAAAMADNPWRYERFGEEILRALKH
jgi:ribonuclease D